MKNEKYKLLKTVQSLYEKGSASLTASEQAIIEQETRELLNSAKTAAKAPEGFDNLLDQLRNIQNADEAFEAVLSFLKDKGELDKGSEKPEGLMDDGPKGPGKGPKGPEMGDGPELDKDPESGKGPMSGGMDMDDMKKSPEGPMGGDPKGPGKGPEKGPEKGECPKGPVKEDKKPFGKEKIEDKEEMKKEIASRSKGLKNANESEEDLEELKEDDSDEDVTSSEALGIKSAINPSQLKVKVTPAKNITVSNAGKPVFIHTVAADIKEDDRKLVRLANKIAGWCLYEGFEVAASRCGTTVIGGVDDGIDLAFDAEVSPVTDPVTEGAEDVEDESQDSPASDVTEGAEFVTDENPKNSSKTAEGVDEGIDFAVQESVDSTPSSVTDKSENNTVEKPDTQEDDTQAGSEVDFQTVEANLKELYKNRYSKEASKMNKDFIASFIKSLKIATTRMLKNHDEHPIKAAAFDILTDEDVVAEVDYEGAAELAEMIVQASHDEFLTKVLKRTSELMKMSPEYLNDAEKDLNLQDVRPVEVTANAFMKASSTKSKSVRKEAMDGNFSLIKAPASGRVNNNTNGGLRSVVGSTLMGQRVEKLSNLKKKHQ